MFKKNHFSNFNFFYTEGSNQNVQDNFVLRICVPKGTVFLSMNTCLTTYPYTVIVLAMY